MKPAFEDENLWRIFKEELLTWEGTPYRHLQCTKGAGADCTLFLADVLLKTGILLKVERPRYYAKDWYVDPNNSIIHEQFQQNFNKHSNPKYQWEFSTGVGEVKGDILLFSLKKNRQPHHSAILLEKNNIFHVSENQAAMVSKLTPKFKKYCKAFYRLMEK